MLSLVQVTRDGAMIEAAHDEAAAMLEEDPQLSSPEHTALSRELRLMFKDAHVRQGG
jgi:ATP-dependent DNA helicase RecG